MKLSIGTYTEPQGKGWRFVALFRRVALGAGWKIQTHLPQKFFYFNRASMSGEIIYNIQIGRLMFGVKTK